MWPKTTAQRICAYIPLEIQTTVETLWIPESFRLPSSFGSRVLSAPEFFRLPSSFGHHLSLGNAKSKRRQGTDLHGANLHGAKICTRSALMSNAIRGTYFGRTYTTLVCDSWTFGKTNVNTPSTSRASARLPSTGTFNASTRQKLPDWRSWNT